MATGPSPRRNGFAWQVLIGVAAGVALGLLARSLAPDGAGLARALDLAGSLFVQLLKALVPPLVFTAIVASVARLRDLENAAGLVWRTLLWFAITALIAVTIGLVLGTVIEPGRHADVTAAAAAAPSSTGSWLDFLHGLVPANMLGLEASTKLKDGAASTALGFNVLQIVIVALAVGIAAVRRRNRSSPSTRRSSRSYGVSCGG